MSVHFTCPSKRHEDEYCRENGITSTMCPGHKGSCQVLGGRRPHTINTVTTTKPLKETSDTELIELARKFNLDEHALVKLENF